MLRTFKYPAYPNVTQERKLDGWRRCCCWLYNAALEQRTLYYKRLRTLVDPERLERDAQGEVLLDEKGNPRRKSNPTTYNGQSAQLTSLRQEDRDAAKKLKADLQAELQAEGRTDEDIQEFIDLLGVDPVWWDIPVEVLRSPLKRVKRAFDAFFRRLKAGETPGYPRFRSARRYDSIDLGRVTLKKDRVHIPKLGHVKLSLYRPIEGEIKSATIRRDATGKWWVSLVCEVGVAPSKIPAKEITETNSVGIDLGITDLVTLSTGEAIPNPRFAKHAADQLARQQRALARKQKGSKNRERQRVLVAKAHAHTANQRLDYARKLTKALYDRFDAVFYEELNLLGLCRGDLSKSFADAAWGILLRCLVSKAEEAGKYEHSVGARLTSQLCSRCGERVPKERGERTHDCPYCGLTIGRDHNAALVVKRRGLDAFWSRRTSTLKEKPLNPSGI